MYNLFLEQPQTLFAFQNSYMGRQAESYVQDVIKDWISKGKPMSDPTEKPQTDVISTNNTNIQPKDDEQIKALQNEINSMKNNFNDTNNLILQLQKTIEENNKTASTTKSTKKGDND